MRKVVFIIAFLSAAISKAQVVDTQNSISVNFFGGTIIEHDTSLKTAIQGNPFGVLVSYNYVKPESTTFNNLFNYPERGYSLLYQNFNSYILGEVVAGYRHFNYRINPNKKDQLSLSTGFGIGYINKKYDEVANPFNFAHGSHLKVSAFFKFQFAKWMLNEQLQLNSEIGIIHFSNISFKNPNLGSNSLIASIGFKQYLNDGKTVKREILPELSDEEKAWRFGFVLRAGYNESREPNSGLYPFYRISGFIHKKLNPYSNIIAGLDFSDAEFLEHYIPVYNQQNNTNYQSDLTKRAGIFIGHELTQNNFAFVTQIGYAFYYPFPYISPVYERFGFKYNLSDNFLAEVTMKVNLFRAEALEFGIGYQF